MFGRRRKEQVPEREQMRFATREDLGQPEGYEDVPLPSLGRLVRVRYLDTPELARMQFLPDVAGFADLITKLKDAPEPEKPSAEDVAAEALTYQAWVVHLSVMDPDDGSVAPCPECVRRDQQLLAHPRSLWTPAEARRLHSMDADLIVNVALRVQGRFAASVPFSGAGTPSGSLQPAATGESTRPTS